MAWKKIKISSFLTERESRIKPTEANRIGLKRLNKIDFSGEIHLTNKPTNTDMILIKRGDLVISGINVEKGAVAVYQGDEDIIATIHYSAYVFDETKIDIEYFKTFLKSQAFKEVINSQTRSGIKTELKAKHFLPLEINLPDLENQIRIKDKINLASRKISDLDKINNKNSQYIKNLRQQILQEAVQGKLVKQDPKDEPASILLKKIKAEKEKLIKEGKIKKQKPLPTIEEDEVPYDLPKGWEWIYFIDLLNFRIGKTPTRGDPKYWNNGIFPWVSIRDMTHKEKVINTREKISSLAAKEVFKNPISPKGTILMSFKLTLGKLSILDTDAYHNEAIISIFPYLEETKKYLWHFLPIILKIQKSKKDVLMGQTMNSTSLSRIVFPLPPLPEQARIVEKVDKLMAYCDELEKQVKENQQNSEKLMGAVLKESFIGHNDHT